MKSDSFIPIWMKVYLTGPGVGPRRVRHRRVGPQRVGSPKFHAFLQCSFFLLSLGGPFVEFWWCFLKAGTMKCARLGSRAVETPAAFGPPAIHTTARELQTCPPKFHERTPKREKKERNLWREREKKERNFGRSGGGRSGGGGSRWGWSGCGAQRVGPRRVGWDESCYGMKVVLG